MTNTLVLGDLALSAFFTRAQALDSGISDRELANAVRAGIIVRLRHGCYALASVYASLNDVERHVLLARCVVASQRGRVALAGYTAAAAHGFRLHGHDLDHVQLLRLDGGSSRRVTSIDHHVARWDDGDLVEIDGLLTTSPARTVWDVACSSGLDSGLVTADSALRVLPDLPYELEQLRNHFANLPGSRQARLTLSIADPGAENGGESVCRATFFRYGIPRPTLQQEIFDGDGVFICRSDFCWEEFRHVGEFDGKVKYERYLRPGESPGDAVFREKKREDLVRRTRRGVSRFIWSMIVGTAGRGTMMWFRNELFESKRLFVVHP